MRVDDQASADRADHPKPPSGLKLLLELGPLLIFFGVYAYAGIFAATAAFIPLTLISLLAGRYAFGKFGVMPVVTAVFVVVLGGFTLVLADETFIKIKPTLVYLLFAAVALVGLAFNWVVWKKIFGDVFRLTDIGWRKLQFRWGWFFVAMAMLNELIWRVFSTDTWVTFKVFGALPLTFAFALAQIPMLSRYALGESNANGNTSEIKLENGAS